MLCDDCKSKPASIFYKEVLQDKVVELHLCEACAHKRGLMMDQKMSTTEILQKLLQKKSARDEKVICPVCFLSLAEFKRSGRFGCSQCITIFQPHINTLIKQIQQSDRHIGRRAGFGVKRGFEVFRLREDLKKALAQEAYEEAAKIRDKLKGYGVDHEE
jgi:protein arginine kinase activator